MDHKNRTRQIASRIKARDDLFGRTAGPGETGVGKAGRWISDDPSWKALLVPEHLSAKTLDPTDTGADWDLLQLYCYNELRVTAHLRGDEVAVRLYVSGGWEQTFLLFNLPQLPPLMP